MRRNVIALTVIAVLAVGCGDSTAPGGGTVGNQNFLAEASLNLDLDTPARTTFRVERINGNIDVVGVAGTQTFMILGERQHSLLLTPYSLPLSYALLPVRTPYHVFRLTTSD